VRSLTLSVLYQSSVLNRLETAPNSLSDAA
jgi:hypothetical protein